MGILMQDETDYGNLFDTVRHVAQACRGKPHDYSDVVAYIHDDTDIPHYPVPALADSETVLALNHFGTMAGEALYAWDGIWREPIKVCYRLFDY